ncbi:MAG: alpha-L-glutamate ligase [Gammaproteobacteria bacterium]|jgi:hypothetical protein|nr:alpha-L-glutamate ligase [Gammaproteobacteria bacterium]
MQKIYVIHENHEWTDPLKAELSARNLPHEDWFLDEGKLDLSQPPPEGVFYNRMSASSHTRDHRYAPEFTGAVLAWLESHGRRVINSSRALQLEVSKVAQYTTLEAHGVRTPRTVAAVGKQELLAAANDFRGPFITKHNRAGKGLGVRLFQNTNELEAYVHSSEFEEPVDGITLIQQYVRSPEPYITRCEFVGGEFLYAVRVDTSDGFLLCPADECQDQGGLCPTLPTSKFRIIQGFDDPIINSYKRVLKSNSIHVAGIEFIVDENGTKYTYDINTNTNYNPAAEAASGMSGMAAIADYLGTELVENGWQAPQLSRAAAH